MLLPVETCRFVLQKIIILFYAPSIKNMVWSETQRITLHKMDFEPARTTMPIDLK